MVAEWTDRGDVSVLTSVLKGHSSFTCTSAFARLPSYTSFAEVWEAIDRIRIVMEERRYRRYSEQR